MLKSLSTSSVNLITYEKFCNLQYADEVSANHKNIVQISCKSTALEKS